MRGLTQPDRHQRTKLVPFAGCFGYVFPKRDCVDAGVGFLLLFLAAGAYGAAQRASRSFLEEMAARGIVRGHSNHKLQGVPTVAGRAARADVGQPRPGLVQPDCGHPCGWPPGFTVGCGLVPAVIVAICWLLSLTGSALAVATKPNSSPQRKD